MKPALAALAALLLAGCTASSFGPLGLRSDNGVAAIDFSFAQALAHYGVPDAAATTGARTLWIYRVEHGFSISLLGYVGFGRTHRSDVQLEFRDGRLERIVRRAAGAMTGVGVLSSGYPGMAAE
jgi:hypothetical protein